MEKITHSETSAAGSVEYDQPGKKIREKDCTGLDKAYEQLHG